MLYKERLIEILEEHNNVKYIKIETKNKSLWFVEARLCLPNRWGIILLSGSEKPERLYRIKTLLVFIKQLKRNHPIYAWDPETTNAFFPLADTYEIDNNVLILKQAEE